MFKTPAECERAFYEAFMGADLEAMRRVWSPSEDVCCVHPRGVALVGAQRVAQSWQRIFAGGARMSVALFDRGWVSDGVLAVHTLEEHIGVKGEGSQGKTICTNVYRLEGDAGWRMVRHHSSPLPRPTSRKGVAADAPAPTLH